MGSSAGSPPTRVEASLVSAGCGAGQNPSPAASAVESVLIILSPRENRDTSASSTVCSTLLTVVCTETLIPHTVSHLILLFLCFSDMCRPPFPFPCHKDAVCRSTKQNYTCTCKPGFTGDGHNCTGTDSQHQDVNHSTIRG